MCFIIDWTLILETKLLILLPHQLLLLEILVCWQMSSSESDKSFCSLASGKKPDHHSSGASSFRRYGVMSFFVPVLY